MESLTERQQALLKALHTKQPTTVEALASQLQISTPTAYRDARELIDKGFAKKTRGGLLLIQPILQPADEGKCVYCGGPIQGRGSFMIQMTDGTQRNTCCPHCGIMALDQPGIATALASDFLYGRKVNAGQAAFLVSSSVSLCCEPSVLCFRSLTDAEQFQKGFGGEICTLDEAKTRIMQNSDLTN